MTRQVFFLPSGIADKVDEEIVLPADLSHQIVRVLKLEKGDLIELKDESGRTWRAQITHVSKKGVRVTLLDEVFHAAESPLEVTLFMAIARSDRVDLAIRQATELGVKEIVLFPSARSPYRLEKLKVQDRVSRWSKIAQEAVCQCRRVKVPNIWYGNGLDEILDYAENGEDYNILKLVASEMDELPGVGAFFQSGIKPSSVAVAIGPEGGWAEEELSAFKSRKWVPISLGPRILRYETAMVAIVVLCQFLWGDMR
ncbi:MAG: RsmE family RNA methyltransferase [Thermodesulforhabdaceae bacterium]